MVRVDRATGKRVFGTFPTNSDPKPQVIWEAFQPETEPRRSFRRSVELASARDEAPKPASAAAPKPRAEPKPPVSPTNSADFLQREGGIY